MIIIEFVQFFYKNTYQRSDCFIFWMKEGDWVIDSKNGEIGRIIGIDGDYAFIGRYNYQGKTKMKLDDLQEYVI